MTPSNVTTPFPFGRPAVVRPDVSSVPLSKNIAQRLGFWTLLVYLFSLFSVLTEVSTELFGFKPYISIIVGPLAIALTFISGQLFRPLKSRIGVFVILFLAWMVLASPFTTYRTGTLNTLTDVFFRSYSIVFMIAAFAISLQDCKRIIYMIAGAGFVIAAIVGAYGAIGGDGRFSLSFGSLINPNDLATHLLCILPFCLIVASNTKYARTVRPLALAVALLMIYFALKTASRSAVISLAIMSVILLIKATPAQRMISILCLVLLAGVSVAVLPSAVWDRFITTINGEVGQTDVAYAIASRESRIALLQRSVEVTMEHPLFGVGPGVFIAYEEKAASEKGARSAWVGTHNSYTQVSSENGLPGMLFFAGAILAAIFANARIYRLTIRRPDLKEFSSIALFMMVGMAGLAVNIFFSHIAYRYYLPAMLGLSISLYLAAQEMLQQKAVSATSAIKPVTAAAMVPNWNLQPAAAVPKTAFRLGGTRKQYPAGRP